MNVNFPERIWCNSCPRRLVQHREVGFWRPLVRARSALQPVGRGRFLEIRCGNGAVMLLRAFSLASLEAMDSALRMLRLAAQHLSREYRNRRVSLLEADAQQLPLADASVGEAFNFGIVHHLEDWRRGMRELARVLRPGGMFFFEEIYPPLHANWLMRRIVLHPTRDRFHSPESRSALAEAGLDLAEGAGSRASASWAWRTRPRPDAVATTPERRGTE